MHCLVFWCWTFPTLWQELRGRKAEIKTPSFIKDMDAMESFGSDTVLRQYMTYFSTRVDFLCVFGLLRGHPSAATAMIMMRLRQMQSQPMGISPRAQLSIG